MHPETKSLILEVAAKHLVETGGRDLTVRKLATASGVTTQAIYTLYGGKEGVIIALFEEGWRRLVDALESLPAEPDPIKALMAIGYCYVRFARENSDFYELMIGRSLSGVSAPKRETLYAESWQKVSRGAIQRAVDQQFLSGRVDDIGAMLWTATHGFIDLTQNGFLSSDDDQAFLRQTALGVFLGFAGPRFDHDGFIKSAQKERKK